MKKVWLFLFVGILALGLIPSGLANAQSPVLRVGTEAGFMPFEYVDDKTNELSGFDMDLIRAIGQELGMTVQISNINWDGLIPGLLSNHFDVLIAGITITEERAQSVNFSTPYFESVLTIMVRQENNTIQTLDDLAGKTAAVQISTTGDFVAEELEGIKGINRYNTVPEAMQAVINRNADAALIDLPVAQAYLAHNPATPLKAMGAVSDSDFFGIAVRKQNTELLEKINGALESLKTNGIYDELYNKWFGATN